MNIVVGVIGIKIMKHWDGRVLRRNGCGLVDGEIWEHLDTVTILYLVLDPALRSAVVHLEGTYLQTSGAPRDVEGDLCMF